MSGEVESFQLYTSRMLALFDSVAEGVVAGLSPAEAADVVVDLEILLVDHFDDPALHDADDALLLAWFVYLLAINNCFSPPEGFVAKGLLAHAVSGPVRDRGVVLQVRAEGGPPVISEPLLPGALLERGARTTADARARLVSLAVNLLSEASRLIPAARAAAANPPGLATLSLDQEAIDEIGIVPVPSDQEEMPTDIDQIAVKIAHGPMTLSDPGHPEWCIQGLVSVGDYIHLEILDPVHWESGPALPEAQIEIAHELGFEDEPGMWVLQVPGTDDGAILKAAEVVKVFISRAWKNPA